jgi:hypothetical protein
VSDIIKYVPSEKQLWLWEKRRRIFAKVYYDGYTGYLNEMYLEKNL